MQGIANNLKVLELGIFDYNFTFNSKLIQQILSFDSLKILSCQFNDDHLDFSIDALPPNLEQLILNDVIIDINVNQSPFTAGTIYWRQILLIWTVNRIFFEFPTYLLCMKNLEYLNLHCILCDITPTLESFQSLPIEASNNSVEHLSPFMPNFDKIFKVIEILEVQVQKFS